MYPSSQFPYYGTFVKEMEDALIKTQSVEIERIVITKSQNYIIKAVSYLTFFSRVVLTLGLFGKKYDVVHAHFLNHTLIPFFFLNKSNMSKWVFNGHGSDVFPEKKRGDVLGKVSKWAIRKADSVVVPSEYFKKEVVKKFSLNPNTVFISPSGGVDVTLFRGIRAIDPSRKVVGFLGRIEENKGINLFLDAISLSKTKGIKAKIAGTGEMVHQLNDRIKQDRRLPTTKYLGAIAKSEVPQFFDDIDLFLFLSDRKGESLGLTALEALAASCPVLALDRGAVRDFVLHDENGYLVPQKDPQQIAKWVDHFFSLDQQQTEKMKNKAYSVALKYDSASIGKDLVNHYYHLMSSSSN